MSPDPGARTSRPGPGGRPPALQELSLAPHEVEVDPGEVARLAQCDPGRWGVEIAAGIAEGRSLAAPRGRWLALDAAEMHGLFAGGTPVEAIAARGACWAFIATIGETLEARVRDHLGQGRYLPGVILDAVGSVAVEDVCRHVERLCAGAGPSARFSPGYCLWRLENQRALFDRLRPEAIGIALRPSLLMQPLKSVSGIIVKAAAGEDLIVPPEECAPCEAVGCARRGVTSDGSAP